jgi:hypothetical protein
METICLKLINIYKDLKVFLLARRALLILLLLNYTFAKPYFCQTILLPNHTSTKLYLFTFLLYLSLPFGQFLLYANVYIDVQSNTLILAL